MSQKIIEDFAIAVRNERKATLQVLEMINLIEHKRLHLELGYSSLFDFLVRGHQYSEGAAMRRINSARLLRELPVIAPQVQSGELKLSQLSTAKQMLRATELELSPSAKAELLQQVVGKTQRETESLLSQELQVQPPQAKAKPQPQSKDSDSVVITLTFTKEQMQALEQLQNLESHLVPDKDPAKLIVLLLERELARKSKTYRRIGGEKNASQVSTPKSVTPALRRNLLQQHKCCQYRSPKTGQQCNSTYQLQVEHIKPRWAGGTNEQTNLTVLCAAHNRHRYLVQSGRS